MNRFVLESCPRRLLSGGLALIGTLLAGIQTASAAPLNITYSLTTTSKVSLNIYDSTGKIVRELLHTAARTAGSKTETWDGRDDAGNVLPAATYSWKMLSTPGFGATYITSPGANYTLDQTAPFWAQSAGCHGGPQTVAVDSTGFYVAGQTENIETSIIKQSLSGSSRVWSNKNLVAWEYPASLAATGTSLWQRYASGAIYQQDTATGNTISNFSATYSGENPTDMAANATSVIFSYPTAGVVRWLDYTGTQTRLVSVAGANTIDVAADGTVYVISGTDLCKITPAGTTSTVLVSGLVSPKRAAVNLTNGAIYVLQTGASQQVKRYSSAGALLSTYGVAGGRVDGVYATQKTSFRGATDIAVETNGNFWVAEPDSAPRRVARFNSSGTWLAEYYGGQKWAPWIFAEPDDVNYVWMCSAAGEMMRCQINYTSKTWSVHSTYHYEGKADGLISGHNDGAVWEARVISGTLYICRVFSFPVVFKVDRTNSVVTPVVRVVGDFSSEGPYLPAWVNGLATTAGAASLLWTDANGDGRPLNVNGTPQTSELQFSATAVPRGNTTTIDQNLNYLFYKDGSGLKKHVVTSYNGVGSPVYGNFPNVTSIAAPPSRMSGYNDDRWSAFLTGDTAGNIWGAFNPNTTSWGTSDDAFVARWNSAGTLSWQAGRKGSLIGNTRTLRRIFGVVNNGVGSDCVVVAAFSYEWAGEGVTPVYVYDQDGLYAGQLIGQPLNGAVAKSKYGLGGEALAGTINSDSSGNIYLYGHWINEGRIYKITGWTGWQRASGSVVVPGGYSNPAFTPEIVGPNGTGTGIYAQYWDNMTLAGAPVLTRVDAAPANTGLDYTYNVNGSTTNSPTGTAFWSARWTGTVKPRRTGWHMFQQMEGVGCANKIFVNGVSVTNWESKGGWDTMPGRAMWLTAGTNYNVQIEYVTYSAGLTHAVKFQWAEPETNGAFVNVPTTQLVPVIPTPTPTPAPLMAPTPPPLS